MHYLIVELKSDLPNASILMAFCSEYADEFHISRKVGDEKAVIVQSAVALASRLWYKRSVVAGGVVSCSEEDREAVLYYAMAVLRICLREPLTACESAIDSTAIQMYVDIIESIAKAGGAENAGLQGRVEGGVCETISTLAVRCFMNSLHLYPDRILDFCKSDEFLPSEPHIVVTDKESINGVHGGGALRLLNALACVSVSEASVSECCVAEGLTIRALFMLISAEPLIATPLIHSEVMVIMIQILSLCLSQFENNSHPPSFTQSLSSPPPPSGVPSATASANTTSYSVFIDSCKFLFALLSVKSDGHVFIPSDVKALCITLLRVLDLHSPKQLPGPTEEQRPDASPLIMCQLHALQVAMLLSPDFVDTMSSSPPADSGSFRTILRLLLNQLIVNERSKGTDEGDGPDGSYMLAPLLIVLTSLASSNVEYRHRIAHSLFEEPLLSLSLSQSGPKVGLKKGQLALKGTCLFYLLELMTSLDPCLYRYSAELLWEVCAQDQEEFVRRTGVGNAVGLLTIKGIM